MWSPGPLMVFFVNWLCNHVVTVVVDPLKEINSQIATLKDLIESQLLYIIFCIYEEQ